MSNKKTITFAFMDPPFENERTVTFFRLLDATLDRHVNVKVFAYEGAAALSFALQKTHGNSIHGRNEIEEDHPLTKNWIETLQAKAASKDLQFDWINCGLCADERGVGYSIRQCGRGSPSDLWRNAKESFNTLIIGTR